MEKNREGSERTPSCSSCLLREPKPVQSTFRLVILRENLQGQAQILLKAIHSNYASKDNQQNKKKEDKKKRIEIVVASRFRLPRIGTGEDAIKVVSSLLQNYQFGQPCIFTGHQSDLIVLADPSNGFFAQPIPPYEWVSFRQALEDRPVKLLDNLAESDLNWEYIFNSLNFLPFYPIEGDGDAEERFMECRYSAELPVEERHDKVSLLPFRIGPFGRPEVLMKRSTKVYHRLIFPSSEKAKSSVIEKALGLNLTAKAPILKRKCHVSDESLVVVLCRVDSTLDGFGSASFSHDGKTFIWRDFTMSLNSAAGRISELRHSTSTEKLEVSAVNILQELDHLYGGSSGWKRTFKTLGVSQKTPAYHPYHCPCHHQHHDHHHLSAHRVHHYSHHIHLGIHPNHHHHHHDCHGKQYLAALWNGTYMHLLSRSPFKGSVKALPCEDAEKECDAEEQQAAEWQVVSALDIITVIQDLKLSSKDRILLVTMLNMENTQCLMHGGVDSLSSRLLIRTNMILGLEKTDRSLREASPRSVFLVKGVEVIRAGESNEYDFKSEAHLANRLDVAILDCIAHVNRHHGDLEAESMDLLIAKLEDVFKYASRRSYTQLIVSVGQYEWKGIPTHALLEALKKTSGLFSLNPILVLERCFDERDREDALSVLNSSTL